MINRINTAFSPSYDIFFCISIGVLALNFISQKFALPLQCILLAYAVFKADIRLLPGMFVLMLDKRNFLAFEATLVKVNVGIALSPQNIFLIAIFFAAILGLLRGWYDKSTAWMLLPLFSCSIPMLAMALPARRLGLTNVWQIPFVNFMTPALYFWGIRVARTWEGGYEYFVKRMILIFAMLNALELVGAFKIFTFASNIFMVGLFFTSCILRVGIGWTLIAATGSICGIGATLFSRYIITLEETGFASGTDVGSTFSRVFVLLVGIALMVMFYRRKLSQSMIRRIPYLAFIFCTIVFVYAVARARTTNANEVVDNTYRTLFERFEYKLIGDRGTLWAHTLRTEVFKPPLFFKRMADAVEFRFNRLTGRSELVSLLYPHNQVLTFLGRYGWWMGLVQLLFLWWTHVRAFVAASYMHHDRVIACLLLAPSAAVFIVVGFTGQSILSANLCSNGLVTMVAPGVIYGVWCRRRAGLQKLDSLR